MFIVTWLFDKIGYMPKIKIDAGVIAPWPFPVKEEKPKTQGKKPVAKKTTVVAKVPAKKPAKPKAK
jgi:hypothetical protein